jgi:uncharacterized protein YjiS (DUF1127 family)
MSLRNRIHKYRQYRQNLHELRSCTDRNLADLGIARTDMRRIAWMACIYSGTRAVELTAPQLLAAGAVFV